MNDAINKEKRKYSILLISLSIVLVISMFISLCIGRYSIKIGEIILYLFNKSINPTSYNVIKYLRIPRILVSVCVGCALSLSGTIYQSLFNNKLVSPDLLGVSQGASVGACFAILLGLSSVMISIFAFLMGFIAVILSLLIAKIIKNKSNIVLILSGLAVGGLMTSLVGLMKYLADNEMKLAEMTYWLLGDLSGVKMTDFYILFPVLITFSIVTIIWSHKLNIVSLGYKEAKSLGVNYKLTMIVLIIIATALTAVSVSISGTISWIGLVIPNIVRLIVGSNNKKVIPVSMLLGSIFMVIVDTFARSISPNEIPLSIITGIIGTPLFIYAIYHRRKEL